MVFLEHPLVNSLGRAETNIGETLPLSWPWQNRSQWLSSAVVAVMDYCFLSHLGMHQLVIEMIKIMTRTRAKRRGRTRRTRTMMIMTMVDSDSDNDFKPEAKHCSWGPADHKTSTSSHLLPTMPSAPDDNDDNQPYNEMMVHLKCSGKVEIIATSPKSCQDWCVVQRQVSHHVELDEFLLEIEYRIFSSWFLGANSSFLSSLKFNGFHKAAWYHIILQIAVTVNCWTKSFCFTVVIIAITAMTAIIASLYNHHHLLPWVLKPLPNCSLFSETNTVLVDIVKSPFVY